MSLLGRVEALTFPTVRACPLKRRTDNGAVPATSGTGEGHLGVPEIGSRQEGVLENGGPSRKLSQNRSQKVKKNQADNAC
ncbi:hypothetical protein [Bradyrhizobium neotropicale]|uniref:hypothetical protein n=1 Tax=Bradyrhizobium neotropicale TaxID=1497615 RepID=UPI001AD71290|nr:hypothetical protein [Bradyrhizobium neotropicale]MBO4225145.1 hypothetical protein [Bradyrhizobium neotropicale]